MAGNARVNGSFPEKKETVAEHCCRARHSVNVSVCVSKLGCTDHIEVNKDATVDPACVCNSQLLIPVIRDVAAIRAA